MQHGDALNQLAREIGRARQRISAERALRQALPLLIAAGVWAALWLSGLPDRAPPLAQSLSVIAVLTALIWFGLRAWRKFAPATAAEARARLAKDSRLDPGAFEALEDLPAKLDATSVALWRREQERARERADGVKVGPYRFDLQRVDPWRTRFAVAILLVIGALFAGAAAPDRLFRAFVPDPGPLVGDQPMQIEAWLTPAPYTRAAPISLSDRIGERIETPPSVEVTVRLTGPVGAPTLIYEGRGGRREVRFTRAADGAYEARMAVPGRGKLRVVRFLTRANWRVAPTIDAAPIAAFTDAPAILDDDQIAFGWSARDDYGVRRMALRVRPVNPPIGLRGARPVDTEFESPPGDPREGAARVELDLSRHPYAGMEVDVQIVAFDAIGQVGESAPTRLTIPEKVFLQPLAQAAIEIRRMVLWERRPYQRARPAPGGPAIFEDYDPVFGVAPLILLTDDQDPRLERAPEGIKTATRYLDALTMQPSDGYFRDRAVFLGFRLARSELDLAHDTAGTDNAADTLWRTAIRAEYGSAADARRALEMAQQALADAMANGASQERLRQLMQALRQATENYLQALVAEAVRNGEQPENMEDTEEQASMSQRDINELMREVERLMEEGRTAEAQALLQQLAGLLQNLDVRLTQGGQGEGGEQQEGDPNLSQSMDELSEAIGEQRALNDETQQQAQGQGEGQDGEQQGGGQGGDLAQRQAEIRQGLGEAQRQAAQGGAESGALGEAERAMRRSEEALQRGDLAEARAAQDEALSSLRRGANDLAAEMRRRGEEGGEQAGGERDPLGRSVGAGSGDGDTNVPTTSDRVRAREILDDIRRRAQDANRPETERDYLRRLLDRFTGS